MRSWLAYCASFGLRFARFSRLSGYGGHAASCRTIFSCRHRASLPTGMMPPGCGPDSLTSWVTGRSHAGSVGYGSWTLRPASLRLPDVVAASDEIASSARRNLPDCMVGFRLPCMAWMDQDARLAPDRFYKRAVASLEKLVLATPRSGGKFFLYQHGAGWCPIFAFIALCFIFLIAFVEPNLPHPSHAMTAPLWFKYLYSFGLDGSHHGIRTSSFYTQDRALYRSGATPQHRHTRACQAYNPLRIHSFPAFNSSASMQD